jgi:tRNA pseudouridine55 synthase
MNHPLHGWLVLDKPTHITSAHALRLIKPLVKPSKLGHAGTLDPLASGILPIAIGEATKAIDYVMMARKDYMFTITWGEQRTTADAEGEVIHTSDHRPKPQEIQDILPKFLGIILQTPPAYSAIKVDGQRAYALSRQGKTVELAARPVEIYDLKIVDQVIDSATFSVACGKGTYVRSLAEDIAKSLSTVGYVSYLRRTAVGPFLEKDSVSLDKVLELNTTSGLKGYLLSLESALDDIPAVVLDEANSLAIRQGKAVCLVDTTAQEEMTVLCKTPAGTPLAFCTYRQDLLHPKRVFNL